MVKYEKPVIRFEIFKTEDIVSTSFVEPTTKPTDLTDDDNYGVY